MSSTLPATTGGTPVPMLVWTLPKPPLVTKAEASGSGIEPMKRTVRGRSVRAARRPARRTG
nr:hypothetical protein [Streptomyces sp. DSM 44938]